ncbi:MAG: hypothetical protein E6J41_21385 [Chloroflexi bacterium]|nr:MAG: hypothetical protein E6J41_21385 [Chloroflexota bacterium]
MRQPILYAELMWRNQRLWVLMLVLAGLVISPAMFILNHGRLDSNTGVFLLYLPLGLLYGAAMLFYRQRSALEVRDDGLVIHRLVRSIVVPYDLIRNTRLQKLETHFLEGRKRLVRPVSRPLMQKDALFVRLRGDDPRTAELRRVLGSQLIADDTLAVPVPDPDAMSWEITSRLPERTSVNLGGQRRKKRARAR